MIRALISLNFMYCMERFATQIYRTQKAAFNDDLFSQQLTDASENERTHVTKLQEQIRVLNGRIYPFGFLFQTMGIILGLITRLSGKRNLMKADIFVENRAIKDYNSFLKAVSFDEDTVKIIRALIADEEVHVINWQNALESLSKKK